LHNYTHKKLAETIARLDRIPADVGEFSEWIKADAHLAFLRANALSDEVVIHAIADYTFIDSIVVPNELLAKMSRADLAQRGFDSHSPIASYVSGGGKDEMWIERGVRRGYDGQQNGTQLVFSRTFEGWSGPGRNYVEVNQEYTHLAEIHWREEKRAYCRFSARDWRALIFHGHGSLLRGKGLRRPLPHIAAGEAIVRGTLSAYAPRWRCGLTVGKRLRVCTDCLADGYHSVFFQIEELRRCPVHGVLLQEVCAECGAHTREYEPGHSSMIAGFTCRKCRSQANATRLAKPGAETRLSADLITLKLKPLAQWISEAEKSHRGDAWRDRLPLPEMERPWSWGRRAAGGSR
jgi:hypothetical protein